LNGSFRLTSTTVVDDLVADTITGGAGMDWFWANQSQDTLTDKMAGEVVN
jgi:hypothetical protein